MKSKVKQNHFDTYVLQERPRNQTQSLRAGMKLNDTYVLMEEIGSGGGGIVYKAYHERLQTYVVVKQIKDRVKGILENRTEVDILKNLKSTYLPKVYDFLEIDGEIYTVMEYIPGRSLAEELEEKKKLPPKDVLKWTRQLAETLSYLHGQERPIIHSDIKPGNIMLTPGGNICLIDFNISLAFHRDQNRTLAVSRGYSPPEQYSNFDNYQRMTGKRPTSDANSLTETQHTVSRLAGQGVDERSDIYALGATIYHLLTGVRPAYDYENISSISSSDIEVGEAFALILDKMMALDPGERYQNGMELLDALDHIYELDSEYRAYRRNRGIGWAVIGAVFLAACTLTGYSLVAMNQENMTYYNQEVEAASELIEGGEYEQALTELNTAMLRRPKKITAYERYTYLLYTWGEYEETITYGQSVINNVYITLTDSSDYSSLANIFYLMGNSYMELEDNANAASCLKQAIDYDSANGAYYRDYAVVLARTGNTAEAEEALEQAIALGLGQDTIYMTRGEISYAQGNYEEAVSQLSDAILATQDSDLMIRAAVLIAKSYVSLGDEYLGDEISFLETTLNNLGLQSNLQLQEMLADAYASMAQLSEGETADEYYEKALSGFMNLYQMGYSTRQMMENIAILYQEMGQFDEASDMLWQMAEQYPDDYRAYKRLAFLEADIQQGLENSARDYSLFLEYYETALQLYETAGSSDDTEMQMLEVMLQDLQDGGWFDS